MDIDLPDIVKEIEAVFWRYEHALTGNDVPTLNELFWNAPQTVRYGIGEQLYGYDSIVRFRLARTPIDLRRTIEKLAVTSYGRDFATASCEYRRKASGRQGRQTQTWVRTREGWRVVAAHVSLRPVE